jgi:hypothetical protein
MKNVCFLTLLKTNRGLSLVEILAAVAIITMVIGPFMGSFIEATKNNVFSENKIKSSMLAQKTMEEIKAMNYIELDRRMALPKIGGSDYIEYSVDGTNLVKYKIEKESNTVVVTPAYVMEDLTGLTYPIVFEVSTDSLQIKTFNSSNVQDREVSYNLLDNPQYRNCIITYNLGQLEIRDYAEPTPTPLPTPLPTPTPIISAAAFYDLNNTIYYKVRVLDGCTKNFTLNVNFDAIDVLDESDGAAKKIRFYVIDDVNSNFILNNKGVKQIRTLNKLTTSTQSYRNFLYKIEVVVENNGEELNKLISYLKK